MSDKPYYTPQEVAQKLKIGVDTVRRSFRDVPGVCKVAGSRHEHIRIPEDVLERWIGERSRGFVVNRRTR